MRAGSFRILSPTTYQKILGSNMVEIWHAGYGITTASGAVSSWVGQKAGLTYTQATTAQRPTYTNDGTYFGGKNILKFTRAALSNMTLTATIGSAGQYGHIISVIRYPTTTAPDTTNEYFMYIATFTASSGASIASYLYNTSGTLGASCWYVNTFNGRFEFTGLIGVTPTIPYMHEMSYDGVNLLCGTNLSDAGPYVNGQAAIGAFSSSRIGADPASTPFRNTDMSLAMLILCDHNPTFAERVQVLALAKSDWGII